MGLSFKDVENIGELLAEMKTRRERIVHLNRLVCWNLKGGRRSEGWSSKLKFGLSWSSNTPKIKICKYPKNKKKKNLIHLVPARNKFTAETHRNSLVLDFVEPNFVWSNSTTQPDQNNIAWFLMGDLLRLSPWSRGLGQIGPSWSAHGQASWGSKGIAPGKKFRARFYIETDFGD